jgi:hypothetical protein
MLQCCQLKCTFQCYDAVTLSAFFNAKYAVTVSALFNVTMLSPYVHFSMLMYDAATFSALFNVTMLPFIFIIHCFQTTSHYFGHWHVYIIFFKKSTVSLADLSKLKNKKSRIYLFKVCLFVSNFFMNQLRILESLADITDGATSTIH